MASTVLAWPRVPTPAPLAGSSFIAAAFQLGSALFALPGTEQSQLLPSGLPTLVLPRLVSVSPRSKQYDHCASAVALPSALYPGVFGSFWLKIFSGIWPAITDIEVCS